MTEYDDAHLKLPLYAYMLIYCQLFYYGIQIKINTNKGLANEQYQNLPIKL